MNIQLTNNNRSNMMKKSMLSTAGLALLTIFSTNNLMASDLPPGQGSARLAGAGDGAIGVSVVRTPAIISGGGGAYFWTDHRQGDLVWRLTRALEDHERHMHTMLESQQTAVQSLLIQFGNLTARLDQQDRIKLIEQQFRGALARNRFADAYVKLAELSNSGISEDYKVALRDELIGKTEQYITDLTSRVLAAKQETVLAKQRSIQNFLSSFDTERDQDIAIDPAIKGPLLQFRVDEERRLIEDYPRDQAAGYGVVLLSILSQRR